MIVFRFRSLAVVPLISVLTALSSVSGTAMAVQDVNAAPATASPGRAASAKAASRRSADPIRTFTASMQSRDGFVPVHVDPETGKVFLEVQRLNQDFLYVTSMATGLGSGRAFELDRGNTTAQGIVRFERHGPRVFLIRQNSAFTATAGGEAASRNVRESFPVSVLASLPIVEQNAGRLLVDATDLFLSDVFGVQGSVRRYGLGEVKLDKTRSYVSAEQTKAFPKNSEIRAVLTFSAETPHAELRRHAPDGRSITLEQHHSFVELPTEPLPARVYDPRTANSEATVTDFSEGFADDYRKRYVTRWRLVPKDPVAYLRGELVEPVEPIVYYLDPALPEPYRSAYREGTLWWNRTLEAAGFRNALEVRDLPEGADPMDIRYSVIQLTHRTDAGPSVGPAVRDPRTGEVIVAMPRMDSHRSLIDYNIYAGLLPVYDAQGIAPQLNPEEFTKARRRQHAAHEVGHTMGLPHNFMGGADNRSSVMHYPFPLIRVDAQGRLDLADAYRPGPGYSDTVAIRYAYTWFPTPEAEAAGLKAIVEEALERGHRFITGDHAELRGSFPEATRWVEGRTMFEALDRTMAVRRLMLKHFNEKAIRPGEPMSWLNQRLAHVYLHHRYSVEGVVKNVGGMEFTYALRGDGQVPTRVIPAVDQRRALEMILTVLSPRELAIPEHIPALIPPTPSGYEEPESWYDPALGVALPPAVGAHATWIESPAGTALDPFAVARSFAQEVVDNLLHPERVARVVSFHARDSSQLSPDELLTRLVDGTWGATGSRAGADGAYRRAAERAVLDGLFSLATDKRATSESRDAAERHLARLAQSLKGSPGSGAADQAHRSRAVREIGLFLTDGTIPELRTGVFPMPLPWP